MERNLILFAMIGYYYDYSQIYHYVGNSGIIKIQDLVLCLQISKELFKYHALKISFCFHLNSIDEFWNLFYLEKLFHFFLLSSDGKRSYNVEIFCFGQLK